MQLGLITPVVSMVPGVCAPWEESGSIDDVVAVAREADRLGYDHVTCSEHIAVPVEVAAARGARYYDPLVTLGYLAAVTTRLRLATSVIVLGYHHPLEIAKRYGTLDAVSNGRLVLGLGVGSLREEFDLLGAPFADRGLRADDAISALRACLGTRRPRYDGPYYRFDDVEVDPCTLQPSVPLWIGGRTARSLRRAVELGDAWMPFGIRASEIASLLAAARTSPAWGAHERPLEIVLQTGRPVDPTADPDGARHAVDRLVAAGATGVQLRFVHRSLAHYLEQLQCMAELLAGEAPASTGAQPPTVSSDEP